MGKPMTTQEMIANIHTVFGSHTPKSDAIVHAIKVGYVASINKLHKNPGATYSKIGGLPELDMHKHAIEPIKLKRTRFPTYRIDGVEMSFIAQIHLKDVALFGLSGCLFFFLEYVEKNTHPNPYPLCKVFWEETDTQHNPQIQSTEENADWDSGDELVWTKNATLPSWAFLKRTYEDLFTENDWKLYAQIWDDYYQITHTEIRFKGHPMPWQEDPTVYPPIADASENWDLQELLLQIPDPRGMQKDPYMYYIVATNNMCAKF